MGVYSELAFVGTPETITDAMKAWLEGKAYNGLSIALPFLPEVLESITDRLVPELQRRGIFRKDYERDTARSLGLPRPENRFLRKIMCC